MAADGSPSGTHGAATNGYLGAVTTGDVMRVAGGWINQSGHFMPDNESPISPRPVNLPWGVKHEFATDLTVPVTGYTFELTREYSSIPRGGGFTNYGLVGSYWSMSAFGFIAEGAGTALIHYASAVQSTVYESDGGSPAKWRTAGGDTRYITVTTKTADWPQTGVTVTSIPVWRVTEPGQWEVDFYKSSTGNGVDAGLHGLIREYRDVYGNKRSYQYDLFDDGLGHQAARLRAIYLNGTPAAVDWDAKIFFSWHLDSSDTARLGRLRSVCAFRHNSSGMQINAEQVDYIYKSGTGDATGTAGDLVEVRHRTLVDGVVEAGTETGSSPYAAQITQYRYHNGSTPSSASTERLTTVGAAHQLKMIISPEQVEFYAQQSNAARSTHWNSNQALLTAADELRGLGDGSAVPNLTAPLVVDFASKIISYETTGNKRVAAEYPQTACGCSGGATQGVKLVFQYLADTADQYRTTVVKEHLFNGGTPEYNTTPYRTAYTDTKQLKTNGGYFTRFSALTNGTLTWVEGDIYDDSGSSPTYQLVRHLSPSAITGYTPASGTTPASATISSTQGLVYAYVYNSDRRPTELRVANGNLSSVSSFNLLAKITYRTGGEGQTWLPKRVDVFPTETATVPSNADLIQTTWFTYGFRSGAGDGPAWIKSFTESETSSENGGSSATVTDPESSSAACFFTTHLFDTSGQLRWVRAADNALTYMEYDALNAALTKVVRNADRTGAGTPNPVLADADYAGVSTSSWGRFDSSNPGLSTTFDHDLLGRVNHSTSPGNVQTFSRRELRPAFERSGVLYAASVSLPHQLQAAGTSIPALFDGPLTVSMYDAGGRQIQSQEFELNSSAAYAPMAGTYLLGAELARSSVQHRLSGLIASSKQWAIFDPVSSTNDVVYTTSYDYDLLGRVKVVYAANGTVTQSLYDVQDRVVESDVGTSTSNFQAVAEYFYDSGGSATQGSGDGNLTLVRAYAGPSKTSARDTVTVYDLRNRPVCVIGPDKPYQVTSYDNLDRPTARALVTSTSSLGSLSGIAAHLTSSTDSQRGLLTTSVYSQRGLVYRSEVAIDPSNLSSGYLGTDRWLDAAGRVLATRSPNGPVSKVVYDGLGRVIHQYTTDRSGSSYSAAVSPSSDLVVEQTDTRFNAAGLPDFVTNWRRIHDDATSTGPLTTSDGVATFAGYYYDNANRVVNTINFGTRNTTVNTFANGTSPVSSWPGSSAPTPSSYPDDLVSQVSYNTRGLAAVSTDPMGHSTAYLYDLLSRRFATIEGATFTDGALNVTVAWNHSAGRYVASGWPNPSHSDENRITSSVFDGAGNVTSQVAHCPTPSGTSAGTENVQVTSYEYGSSTSTSPTSGVASYDLLSKVHYPDETTGAASTSSAYTVSYTYNTQGELVGVTDQNATHHTYTRDALGRATADAASVGTGSPIDMTIKGINASFDDLGRLSIVSSINSSDATANQVKFTYTPLWQVERVYQDSNSAVAYDGSGNPTGDTVAVKYGYTGSARTSDNFSRVSSIQYPDGTTVGFDYAGSTSLDSKLSRPFGLDLVVDDISLVEYSWIGLDLPAVVDYPGIDVQLDRTAKTDGHRRSSGHTSGTSGEYPGYDRFGRVVQQQWVDGDFTTGGTGLPDRPQVVAEGYGYDKSSNRLSRLDLRPGLHIDSSDFVFSYDTLDRLTESRRGTAVSGAITTPGKKSQQWALDMLGNWTALTSRGSDGAWGTTGDAVETRTHNAANELSERTPSGASSLPFTYDDAGNTKTIKRTSSTTRKVKHDAWNRLVSVQDETVMEMGTALSDIVHNTYNGLHWRIASVTGLINTHAMYYSAAWQLLEDHTSTTSFEEEGPPPVTTNEYFWGTRYIDDCVANRVKPASGEPRLYWHLTDVQFSTVAITDSTAMVAERVTYDAYGNARHRYPFDLNGDGAYTGADLSFIYGNLGSEAYIGDESYMPDLDVDRNGYNAFESEESAYIPSAYLPALTDGQISDPSGAMNVIGYDGYMFEGSTGWYAQRFRWYDAGLGRWLQRDPLESARYYTAYEYVRTQPTRFSDSTGLIDEGSSCTPCGMTLASVMPCADMLNKFARVQVATFATHDACDTDDEFLEYVKSTDLAILKGIVTTGSIAADRAAEGFNAAKWLKLRDAIISRRAMAAVPYAEQIKAATKLGRVSNMLKGACAGYDAFKIGNAIRKHDWGEAISETSSTVLSYMGPAGKALSIGAGVFTSGLDYGMEMFAVRSAASEKGARCQLMRQALAAAQGRALGAAVSCALQVSAGNSSRP